MYISKCAIRNYRNFSSATFKFGKGVNTLIGENGSGKTNLFHALRLLVDEALPRSTRFFEHDFNRSLSDWRGQWIIIQVWFDELDSGEEAQAIAMHKVGEMEEFESQVGTYSLLARPNESKRRELYEYSLKADKTQEGFQEILKSISINDYEVTYRGRGNVDFSDDAIYDAYVGDFKNIVFPNPDDEQYDIYGTRLYGFSIPNEVSCTFAKALRDVEADLRSYKDNPLLTLLRGKEKDIPVGQKTEIEEKVKSLNSEISELDEIKNVSIGISKSINESVGKTYAPSIKIQSELPSEIDRLLQSLKLLVGDPDEPEYQGRIHELSLGGANLIYLSLKLLEYEKVKALNKIANFIFIEEPEAHIHTHIQKTLFQKLEHHNTQIIISTHSTHISSVSSISSVNVLSRSDRRAIVFNPSSGLSRDQIIRIERYLDAVRTNLLFAKGVILVEGDAEQILVPELIKQNFGLTLDELGISVINIGSTGFENVAILFNDERIRKHCAIVTDLDSSILPLPENSEDDSREEKMCRISRDSGLDRRERLSAFVNGNQWLEVFYAEYTFEVDFLLSNNSSEIGSVVEDQYSRQTDIARIIGNLDNKDVSISGTEVLRLAEKFGKGWFALLVASEVNHLTEIPNYILDALLFAMPSIKRSSLLSIAEFRLRMKVKSTYEGDETDYGSMLREMTTITDEAEVLDYYVQRNADDVLSMLARRLRDAGKVK